MDHLSKLLKNCELGRITRCEFLQTLGLSATAAVASAALPRAARAVSIRAPDSPLAQTKHSLLTTVNHLSYPSLDYKKTRDFYVDLLGMRAVWDDGTKCQVDLGPECEPNTMYLTSGTAGNAGTVVHFSSASLTIWH